MRKYLMDAALVFQVIFVATLPSIPLYCSISFYCLKIQNQNKIRFSFNSRINEKLFVLKNTVDE
jgi:hypothetical protein